MHTCPFGSPDTRVGRPRPQLRQPRSKAGLAPEWMFLALGSGRISPWLIPLLAQVWPL